VHLMCVVVNQFKGVILKGRSAVVTLARWQIRTSKVICGGWPTIDTWTSHGRISYFRAWFCLFCVYYECMVWDSRVRAQSKDVEDETPGHECPATRGKVR
jgi:hypothetical protein